MFGKEETAAMMFVDFQHEGRPLVRCLFGAGPVPEADSSCRSEIARKTQLSRSDGRLGSLVGAPKWARKRVRTMCTPWASDRFGLGRIGDVCGGVADFEVLEPGSSPTAGTVFPQVSRPLGR